MKRIHPVLLAVLLCLSANAARGLTTTPAPTGRIVLQFTEASGAYVWDGAIQPRTAATADLEAFFRAAAPGFRLQRHFTRGPEALLAERRSAERNSGRTMPDLNRYAHLDPIAPVAREELARIVSALSADPRIERAFLEPVAVPAALGFDAFTRTFTGPAPRTDGPERTPDFTPQQGYLDPAPIGVNAEGVWAFPGGRGETVKVCDIEGAWLWTHEDLTAPFFTAGGAIDDAGWRNHGTAVMGEMRGTQNTFGVTGIANALQVGGSSISEQSVADAINTAAANVAVGDLFLIELHAPGPNANGSGQFGYVCMEYWQDNFDAIRVACANGRICCEAAGNGEQNLDDPVYQGLFDRNVRDSGAILCGATNGSDLAPAWFTNYGSRVDLHGWGFNVVTTGYGDLQGGNEMLWYTAGFSGTSSASPIVTGSVASLQGMAKAAFGIPLNARLARDILVATGTPQTGTQHIGPRPNLTAARTLMLTGIGAIAGVVTDLSTGLPVAGVDVTVDETGAFTRTAADGSYRIPFLAGTYTLRFASFFYSPTAVVASVSGGVTTPVNPALVPRELVRIGGMVASNADGHALAGVRVTPLGVPLPSTVTTSDGHWSLDGVPLGHHYEFRFDDLPGYGADFTSVVLNSWTPSVQNLNAQLPPVTQDFESGAGDFTGDSIWEYGVPANPNGGPSSGFSGQHCWGVGMHADYVDNVHGYLTSPVFTFDNPTQLRLSFHYWCESESGFDGANLQLWNAGAGQWQTLVPLTGYPSVSMGGINNESGWSGSTGGWVGAVFDLSGAGSSIRFRIQFGSDSGVTVHGFWIDEIAFDTGDLISAVPPQDLTASFGFGPAANPVHGPTRFSLTLPRPESVEVGVHDVTGRRIAILHDGALPAGVSEVRWDLRDAAGLAVPGGVYFLRAVSPEGTATKRVLIVR